MIFTDIKNLNLISNLFIELAKSERSLDISGQVLCESTDFDAHQIFNYLVSNGPSNIIPIDISKYLKKTK